MYIPLEQYTLLKNVYRFADLLQRLRYGALLMQWAVLRVCNANNASVKNILCLAVILQPCANTCNFLSNLISTTKTLMCRRMVHSTVDISIYGVFLYIKT
jgi:hypothetical protein